MPTSEDVVSKRDLKKNSMSGWDLSKSIKKKCYVFRSFVGIYYSQYQIILSFMYWAPIQIGKFLQRVSLTVSAMNIVGDSVQMVLGKINNLWTGEMDRYIDT